MTTLYYIVALQTMCAVVVVNDICCRCLSVNNGINIRDDMRIIVNVEKLLETEK